MGDVVNLNRFRKKVERADKKVKAEQNRLLFGRTGAERAQTEIERERARRLLDGHDMRRDD